MGQNGEEYLEPEQISRSCSNDDCDCAALAGKNTNMFASQFEAESFTQSEIGYSE